MIAVGCSGCAHCKYGLVCELYNQTAIVQCVWKINIPGELLKTGFNRRTFVHAQCAQGTAHIDHIQKSAD